MEEVIIFDPLGELKKIAEEIEKAKKETKGGNGSGVQARTDQMHKLRKILS